MKKILNLLLIVIGLLVCSCGYKELTPDDINSIYLFQGDTVKLDGWFLDTVHCYKLVNGKINDSTHIKCDKILFQDSAILIETAQYDPL